MDCASKNCPYKINPNVLYSENKYCCIACKKTPNKHNKSCKQVKFTINPTNPINPSNPLNPTNLLNPTNPLNSSKLKKALLVGINYIENPANMLRGCINDVRNMQTKLLNVNPECKEYRILTDDSSNLLLKPTRKNIVDNIDWLVRNLKDGDSVFFHYSGHGGLTPDTNGDEVSKMDSCIYPINTGKIEVITDDELRLLLVDKLPTGCKAFVVLDCCHSGSALDLRYVYGAPEYGKLIMSQNDKYPKSNGSVIFLSGCDDQQTAADTVDKNNVPSGALTNALLDVWNQYGTNIKFKYLLWDVRDVLKKKKYTQIPQLSCSTNINLNDEFRL